MIIVNQDKGSFGVFVRVYPHLPFHFVVLGRYIYIYWHTSLLDELKAKSDLRPAQIRWWFHGRKLPNFVWWKWQCWATQALTEPNPKPKSTKQKSWWSAWKRMPKGWNHGGNCLLHRWYYWNPNLVWHRPFLNFSLRVASGTHYRNLGCSESRFSKHFSCWQEFTYISLTELSLPALWHGLPFGRRWWDGCAQVRGLEITHL